MAPKAKKVVPKVATPKSISARKPIIKKAPVKKQAPPKAGMSQYHRAGIVGTDNAARARASSGINPTPADFMGKQPPASRVKRGS